jgi:glycosyltransferase involved in cell wall biosynthesis
MARPRHIVAFPLLRENPYQDLLYRALAKLGFTAGDGDLKIHWLVRHRRDASILHFHWPQPWYAHRRGGGPGTWAKLALWGVRLAAARALGYRIAWTIHEVQPLNPAPRWVDRLGTRMLARASDVLLTNDDQTAAQARRELGRAAHDVTVVLHPSYDGAYSPGRPADVVRAELGIGPDAFVFLLFGHITAYKRVDAFVEAFRTADLEDAALIVAGLDQHSPSAEGVRAAASADPRIKAELTFIADDRVSELFDVADAAIAPRQDGGTSGALLLALTMGVPPLVADVPTYARVTDGDRAAWLYTPWDTASIAETMRAAAADRVAARRKGQEGRLLVAPLTWDALAATTASLFDRALARQPSLARRRRPAQEPA